MPNNLFLDDMNVVVFEQDEELVDSYQEPETPDHGSWPVIMLEDRPFTGFILGTYGLFAYIDRHGGFLIDLNTFTRLWNRKDVPNLKVEDLTFCDIQIKVLAPEF